MAVKPGDILRDKYRVDSLIGRGGMGQVFAATNLDSRSQVAIKVVSKLLVDDVMMARLHREAEAASRIQSDWVPRVVEVDDTGSGETFLVMERLFGQSLSQRIREAGALDWPEVARLGEDILRALIDAHTAGIVHRDLKPSNVFLAERGTGRPRAMVLDFGVCKVDGLDVERLTGTGESIGTVAYMAPEQIRGAARVDERADLYAFGVVVFEMLSGRLPHDGPSQMAILASKLENPAARIHHWSKHPIPEGTDELLARTLSREPAGRAANAQDLLKAWRTLSKSDKLVASVPPPPVVEVASEPPGPLLLPPPADADPDDPDLAHPTQTTLTTHGGAGPRPSLVERNRGATRLALLLAAASLVVAGVVVIVAVVRGAHHEAAAAGSVRAVPSGLASGDPSAEPNPSPVESADFELPANAPPSSSGPRVRPAIRVRPVRPAPPAQAPSPKPSAPHITNQPRY